VRPRNKVSVYVVELLQGSSLNIAYGVMLFNPELRYRASGFGPLDSSAALARHFGKVNWLRKPVRS
jgi:hypothetical protein